MVMWDHMMQAHHTTATRVVLVLDQMGSGLCQTKVCVPEKTFPFLGESAVKN